MSIEEKGVEELEEGELDDDDDDIGTANSNNENDESNNNDQSLGSSAQTHAVRNKKQAKNHKKNGSAEKGHERKRKRRIHEVNGSKKSTNEEYRQSSPQYNSSYRSPRRHRKQDESFYPPKRARNREVDRSDVEYNYDIGDGDNQYMENQAFHENENSSPKKDFNKHKKNFPDRAEHKNVDGTRENFKERRDYQRERDRGPHRGGKFDRTKGRFGSQHFEKPPRKSNNEPSGLVCKYFLEGKCLKGVNCTYIHDMNPPKRRELCRYYLTNRGCNKGICFYYHGDWPCKPYHTTGVCVAMQEMGHCQFSHLPLNDETRSLLSIPDDGDGNFRNPPFQEGFNRNFRDKKFEEGFHEKRNNRLSDDFHSRENWNNFENEPRFENNQMGNKQGFNMDSSNERNMYSNENNHPFNKPFGSHYGDQNNRNNNDFDKLPHNNYTQNNNTFFNNFQKDDGFNNPDNKQNYDEKHHGNDNDPQNFNLSVGPYNWTGSFGTSEKEKLKNENETFLPASKNTGENDQEEVGYQKNKSQAEVQNKLDSCQNEETSKPNKEHMKDIRSFINQPPPATNLDATSQRIPFNPLQQPPPLQPSQPFPIQNTPPQRPVFSLTPQQQSIIQLVHPHQPIINLSQQPSILNMTPQQQQPIIQLAQQQLQKQHGFFPPPQQPIFPPQQANPNVFSGILGRGPFPSNVRTQFPILPPQLDINQILTNIVRNSAPTNQQTPFPPPFPIVSESSQETPENKIPQPTMHPPLVNLPESHPESSANKESSGVPKDEVKTNQDKVIEKNEKDEIILVKPVSDPRLKNSNIPNISDVKMNSKLNFEADNKPDRINLELEKEIESPKDERDDLEKDGMASVVKYELKKLDDFQRPTIPIEMIANLKLKGNHQETKELLERDPRLTRYSQPTLKTLDLNFADKFVDPRNQAKLSENKPIKVSTPPFKPLIGSPKFDIKNSIFSQDILSPPPVSSFEKPLMDTSLNDKPAKKVIDYRNDPRYKKKKVASKSSESSQLNQNDKDKNESCEELERLSTTEVKLPGCNDTSSDFNTRASNPPSHSPTPTFPVFCTPGHFSTKLSNSYVDSGGYDTPSEQSTPVNDDEDDDEEDSMDKNLPKINVTSNSFYSSSSTFTPFNLPTTSPLHADAITHESYSKPLAYYKPLHEEESKERLDNSIDEDSSVSIKDMFKSIDPTNSPFC